MSEKFERVALIGLGLIASSIARALNAQEDRPVIVGTARSKETRETAAKLGYCDEIFETPAEAVKNADLVILCTPVGVMGSIMSDIAPNLKEGVVISDVGSVKQAVIDALLPHMPDHAKLVPAHPLAGTEKSGPEAGFAELFVNRWCIITPIEGTKAEVEKLSAFWSSMGSLVDVMTPSHHDLVLAVTSHVPHLIAYTVVGVADNLSRVSENEVIKYSATGFRDFTRIAASDPTMWRDVFLNNKDATLEILERFTDELSVLKQAIGEGNGAYLFDYFTHTRAIRRGIIEQGQDVDLADFGRSAQFKDNN